MTAIRVRWLATRSRDYSRTVSTDYGSARGMEGWICTMRNTGHSAISGIHFRSMYGARAGIEFASDHASVYFCRGVWPDS